MHSSCRRSSISTSPSPARDHRHFLFRARSRSRSPPAARRDFDSRSRSSSPARDRRHFLFRARSRSRSPLAAHRDSDARRDDNRRENNNRPNDSRDRNDRDRNNARRSFPNVNDRFPKVIGPPVKPPVQTQRDDIATAMSRVLQPPDIVRVITEKVQSANDALPAAVLNETRSVVGATRYNFEKVKDIEKLIDGALNNVHNMAQRSPAHPALNGVAAYIFKEPMKRRMRAAIKKKLQEMKEAMSDDEWGDDDDSLPYMGRG